MTTNRINKFAQTSKFCLLICIFKFIIDKCDKTVVNVKHIIEFSPAKAITTFYPQNLNSSITLIWGCKTSLIHPWMLI